MVMRLRSTATPVVYIGESAVSAQRISTGRARLRLKQIVSDSVQSQSLYLLRTRAGGAIYETFLIDSRSLAELVSGRRTRRAAAASRTRIERFAHHLQGRLDAVDPLMRTDEERATNVAWLREWISLPAMALDGRRPLDLLEDGAEDKVIELLCRLAYGVYT